VRSLAFVIAGALVAASPARVAADPPSDLVVADLGLHVVGVGVQHAIDPRVAVQVALDYYAPWTQLQHDGGTATDITGVVVRARAMFYLRAAPRGWWWSPFVQGGVGSAARGRGAVFAGGASIGYAWTFGRVDLALGAGAQYHVARIPGDGPPRFEGVWPHADIIVGWAF
jgi:hypothetical protein